MLYPFFFSLAGDISEEATPDPILNSEVKLFCVDGTAWVTAWESRTSPAFFVLFRSRSEHSSSVMFVAPLRGVCGCALSGAILFYIAYAARGRGVRL